MRCACVKLAIIELFLHFGSVRPRFQRCPVVHVVPDESSMHERARHRSVRPMVGSYGSVVLTHPFLPSPDPRVKRPSMAVAGQSRITS